MRVCVDLQNRQRRETDCRKRVDRKKRGLRDAFYVAEILRRCRSLSNVIINVNAFQDCRVATNVMHVRTARTLGFLAAAAASGPGDVARESFS